MQLIWHGLVHPGEEALDGEETMSAEISEIMHEYRITRDLDIKGIVKPIKIEQSGQIIASISDDIQAVSLREYMSDNEIGINDFLDIAIQLCETLDQIHEKQIIHRDLKPENIIIEPDSKRVYMVNFSNALHFPAKAGNLAPSGGYAGTAPEYMPPEQTGRLEICIDRRSDFYSLGVLFYEIVTGRLPFHANNLAEWSYAHMTQKPEPPEKVDPEVPSVISDIILKLLNKNPEDRYQSAFGLMWDLKECKKQLDETGHIGNVPIGSMDENAHFRLTDKFYGRKKETKMLKDAFRRVCDGKAETILISGEPGIGKTMLVKESLKEIVLRKPKTGFLLFSGNSLKYLPGRTIHWSCSWMTCNGQTMHRSNC